MHHSESVALLHSASPVSYIAAPLVSRLRLGASVQGDERPPQSLLQSSGEFKKSYFLTFGLKKSFCTFWFKRKVFLTFG